MAYCKAYWFLAAEIFLELKLECIRIPFMIITVDSLFKSFTEQPLLKGISFSLSAGEMVGVVGPSGAGKSVLLKLLAQVIPADFGTVSYAGSESKPRAGFLFQEGALFDSMNVLDNVAFPLTSQLKSKERVCHSVNEAYERAYELLSAVGLAQAREKLPGQLSGGMRRRVALARALVNNPDLVLLDDPTGGLDPVAANVIMTLICRLQEQFKSTVVIVSHDIRRLLPRVKRVLALFDGNLVCDLQPSELVSKAPPQVLKFLATRFDFGEPGLSLH